MIPLRRTLLLFLACLPMGLAQAAAFTLEEILAKTSPPAGVVFEIADRDPQALEVSLPWVKQAAERIRQKYPGVPMALVTHGQEMFALQGKHREKNAAVHEQVQSLRQGQGMPVHVCETYANWKGLAPEDFPSYVDVAPSGPSQVNNYVALDYLRLVVPRASELRQMKK